MYNWDFTVSKVDTVQSIDIGGPLTPDSTDGLIFNGSTSFTTSTSLTYGGTTPGVDENAVTFFFEFLYSNYVKDGAIVTLGTQNASVVADNGILIKGGSTNPEILIRIQLKQTSGTNNPNIRTDGNITLNINTYYKIAITQASSASGNATTSMYVDGTLVDSATQQFISGTRNHVFWGAEKSAPTIRTFTGNLRRFIIFNRELTQTEIQSL